ncbi:AMP-binding protein [Thiomicrorhabdus sp. zzn3]|uniref:AMP-binding protein n=1 Tax=Thiomicrorhabdus sp. zzn3 TaxID=3039775 RepID=UPI0024364802|nr:AMP-binding protein [Thiomicrorhabdus sp. zzn3]MDG6778790.1 AMP-binding protein [Thiomicrorhabdus sp. zzn3]
MKWLVKSLVKGLFKLLYRVEVRGLEHYHAVDQSKRPLLIVANHVSLLDGPLIDLFVPGETTFMVGMNHAKKWYGKFVLYFGRFFTVDLNSPYAAKHMIAELKKGKQCMIFPEGRISTTGGLMKVYEGTAMVADKTHAAILPVYIEGAELSKFSYLNGRFYSYIKQFWFPKITLTIQPAHSISPPAGTKGHGRHHAQKQQIFTLMRDMAYYGRVREKSLFQSLVEAKATFHASETCVEDINDQHLSLKKLLLASAVLGKQLHRLLGDEKRVGLMLPNVAGMPATFFALQAYGHVPAMMNFTAGLHAMESACRTAELKTIITSQKFVDAFGLQPVLEQMEQKGIRFILLEEVRERIGVAQKLAGLFKVKSALPGYKCDPHSEAVVLFTSGSEGVPKGVVLSHQNIVSNIEQISAMLNLMPGERLFNALPTFHSFGLTAGLLWPILKGARVFLYPSPLHYAVVPEMVYQTNARIIFGTDTFFSGYARKANPYDFYSVKEMVAGAERLRPETRQLYAEKFHTSIYEGYGVTETTPVLAVNIPTAFKNGSVGQLVPAIEYRIGEVPGIEKGGRLLVKGPNIMLGYLLPDNPGVLVPPEDGWHDTGDIVEVDEDNFVWIKGRAKRFAKIAGEMVSLTAVENYINQASPEGHHVVVAVPDERKGEQLVLVTDDPTLSRSTVTEAAKTKQVADIMVPKTVILVEAVPVLGTGKTNYPEVQKIAERHFKS